LFQTLRENPWPDHERIKRSISRARVIASSDPSKEASRFLYDVLREPFCVFNNESDRMAALFGIGMYVDGDIPGEYTFHAVEAFEPHVLWERRFLEVRKNCYAARHSPRAAQAQLDFDE